MFGIAGEFGEYRCTSCGLIRLDPVPGNLKKYYPSKNYYSYGFHSNKSFFARLRAYFIAHELFFMVPAMPTPGARGKVLDVGCGSGETLEQLRSIGWDAYGVDLDRRAITIAHKRGLSNVSQGSHKDLKKFRNNFFDVIRLYHVVEHIDNPQEFFRLAYDKLKPGGELILGTPNGTGLVARLARQYWYNLDCPRHLFIFSPKNLTRLAKKFKFKNPKVEFFSGGGWVGSLQYIIRQLTGSSVDLINRPWLIMLFYPLEWILDRFGLGDVFVLRGEK